MDLYCDLTTGKLLLGPNAGTLLGLLALHQNDKSTVSLWFLEKTGPTTAPYTVVARPSGFTHINLGARSLGNLVEAGLLFSATDWTSAGAGETLHYTAALNLNTVALAAKFPDDNTTLRALPALLDIELTDDTGEIRRTVVGQWPVTIQRDIFRGTEGAPEDGDPPYPPADQVATKTFAQNASNLTSGTVPYEVLPPPLGDFLQSDPEKHYLPPWWRLSVADLATLAPLEAGQILFCEETGKFYIGDSQDAGDWGGVFYTGSLVADGLSIRGDSSHGTDLFAPAGINVELYFPTLTGATLGYLGIPQVSKSADYTAVLGDAGQHIQHPSADNNPRTFTIPANGSVAFPIGTTLTFVNLINTVTIAITTDTLILAGTVSTGPRTMAANGMATAIKVTATSWLIGGPGVS